MTKLPPDAASSSCETAALESPANTLPRSGKKRLTFDEAAPTSMTSSQTSQTSASVQQAQQAAATAAPSRSFIRLCQKARRVRFFRNGDQYFKGVWYAISPERFRSFEALLEDLTRSMAHLVNLPQGVRNVFTLDGTAKISELDELKDGECYVCSSSDVYKRIDYLNAREPVWSYALPKSNGHLEAAALSLENSPAIQESNEFVHPRLVTVIRSGVKPRRVVRLLLNKRTARTFCQVLGDITAMVKLDSGVVRKLFTLDGKQVTTLADFFAEEDVFIAYGTERMSIDDFYLDSEEYKFLFSSRGRPTRSAKSPRLARRLQGRLDGDQISGASPQLRRRFLHQRNQAIIRSLPRSALGHKAANAENSEQQSTVGSSADTPRASTPDLPSTSALAATSHPFEIEDRFAIGRLIGDGNFAIVHECICKKTKKSLALKIISKANCAGKEDLVENEVAVLRRIDHEHIVKLFDVWDLDHSYYLSMELISGGDLFDALCSVRQYGETDAAHLMRSLMSALDYLHQISIVHRDVKPENLLMYDASDGRKLLKLADFGLATKSDEMLFVVCGTPTYVAPEILAEIGYGTKVDVWAAGIILYVMLCGFPPFQSMQGSQEELFEQILRGRYKFPSPCWDDVSAAAKGLIQGMLQLDVDDRYSAEEVLIHPWITGAARVDPEYEQLAAIAVQSQLRSDNEADEQPMRSFLDDGDNVEYFYSRRRSMDDLSVPASQPEEDSDGDLSFEYLENLHSADNEPNAGAA